MDNNPLSEREREVLRLVSQGKSNKEIAQALFISINTVKVHLANIFKKTDVSSRTEATLYAIEHGLVDSPRSALENTEIISDTNENPEPTAWQLLLKRRLWLVLLFGVGLIVGLSALLATSPLFAIPTSTPNPILNSLSQERWTQAVAMPLPRARMAVTTYQNSIYVIGGVTTEGVTSLVQKFDKTSNQWIDLTEKPTSVSDVQAAVVGGKIFVVGGILEGGLLTNALEVYDPEVDAWDTRSPAPFPLSNYGMADLEGRIYLFGGWDGTEDLTSILMYDPSTDKWEVGTDLPTGRANSAVVPSEDGMFVIGGDSKGSPVMVDEVYQPSREGSIPWSSQIDLPEHFELLGAQNVMGTVFIFGRNLNGGYTLLNYTPQNNVWNEFRETSPIEVQQKPCLAVLGGEVYFIGGYNELGELTDRVVRYQAVYTVVLPRITN
ncbi:MAG: LuxR C-terminal-related transcriptional regulator [Syntrophaceae bacterium]|nr:LuxR C-terminal-related transcriptional regulator [Syntrophaceae bacterium]